MKKCHFSFYMFVWCNTILFSRLPVQTFSAYSQNRSFQIIDFFKARSYFPFIHVTRIIINFSTSSPSSLQKRQSPLPCYGFEHHHFIIFLFSYVFLSFSQPIYTSTYGRELGFLYITYRNYIKICFHFSSKALKYSGDIYKVKTQQTMVKMSAS